MLYVDSNAWISLLRPDEGRREVIRAMFAASPVLAGSQLVELETERVLFVQSADEAVRRAQVTEFRRSYRDVASLTIDDDIWRDAREIAGPLRLRGPDAIHIALLRRIGRRSGLLLTYDKRLGRAAQQLGFSVVGGVV